MVKVFGNFPSYCYTILLQDHPIKIKKFLFAQKITILEKFLVKHNLETLGINNVMQLNTIIE